MQRTTPALRRRHLRRPGWRAATSAAAIVAVGALATGAAGTAATASAATRASGRDPVTFVPIHEVFDGGRVARTRDVAKACKDDTSTLAIVACLQDRTENVDVRIDKVRGQNFAAAKTNAARIAINRVDAAWLAARTPVCVAGYPPSGGGTIVEILVASCKKDLSTARLDAVRGVPVPTASLVATDSLDPDETQYATTSGGARIGAIDTQGDQTGGVVIAWTIIAGFRGFTVAPAAFPYVDGSFVDKGIVQGHPGGHHIAAGHKYVFDIDYSRLAADPNEAKGTGRFEYRSGSSVVGAWK